MVEACPACDSSRIHRRISPQYQEAPFLCDGCGHTFETPVNRSARSTHADQSASDGDDPESREES